MFIFNTEYFIQQCVAVDHQITVITVVLSKYLDKLYKTEAL